MNYGELKATVLDDAHAPELADKVARFVRQAEGLIRRDLTAYALSATMTSADRASGSIYNLPAQALIVRSLHKQGRDGQSLTRVSPGELRRVALTAPPIWYAQLGNGQVEFRGNPSDADIFDVLYWGAPAPLADDSDTNELLSDHESLYIAGAKFWLYIHLQDQSLANDELDIFNGVITTLNKAAKREVGGVSIAHNYNYHGGSSY